MTEIAQIPLPGGGGRQWPDTVVVHAMGQFIIDTNGDCGPKGQCYYATEWLRLLGYSAHVMVDPSGVEVRCRDDREVAYHASGHNENSLGMEILVPGVHDLATLKEATSSPWCGDTQFDAAVGVVRRWQKVFPIAQVVRHSDVDWDRRWYDPGEGFDWDGFKRRIA